MKLMKYLKRFNENSEELEDDGTMMDIINDYEVNHNITIPNKKELCDYLNKFMDDLDYDWNKLENLYDKYDVDSWEGLIIKLISQRIESSIK